MSPRTIVTALVGAILIAGLAGPAVADPLLSNDDDRTTVCLRTEGQSGAREGVCVWIPLPH